VDEWRRAGNDAGSAATVRTPARIAFASLFVTNVTGGR
jgi:hypothetical protein